MPAFKLDADLAKRLDGLATDIRDMSDLFTRITDLGDAMRSAIDDLRETWSERSEQWQESDAGMAADAWLDGLEELADTLEAVEGLDDLADALDTVESKPEA